MNRVLIAKASRFKSAQDKTPVNSDLDSGDDEIEYSVPEDQPNPVAKNKIKTNKITSEQQRIPEAENELMQGYLKTIQEREAQKKKEDENKKLTDAKRNAEREILAEELKNQTEEEKRRKEEEQRREEEKQRREEEKQRRKEEKQRRKLAAAKRKIQEQKAASDLAKKLQEKEEQKTASDAISKYISEDTNRPVSPLRNSLTSLGNVTQNNASLLEIYDDARNQSHTNPMKPKPESSKPESPKTESPTSELGQQTKPPALVGIGLPSEARTLPYNKGYIYPQQQHPVQRLAQSPSQPLQSPRSPLLQQPAQVQVQSPSSRSPQEYLVPGLKPVGPVQRPSSAPGQKQRQPKPNTTKQAWNNSLDIGQGPYLQSNDQNGNTNNQSIINNEKWGKKRQLAQLAPIEPLESLKTRPASAPASNKSETPVSDNQYLSRPKQKQMPETQFSSRSKQNAQNYNTSSKSYESDDGSLSGDKDEIQHTIHFSRRSVGKTAVPIIETTEDKIRNNIREHFEQFKITLLQIVEAILKTFEEIFQIYSTFFFDNVGKTLIQQDNVQPYAIFYIFIQHIIFKLTQITNILNSKGSQHNEFDYKRKITELNKTLNQKNAITNMNSAFADSEDSDKITNTKKITLDPNFYKHIYNYVESFKLITDDLMTSSIVYKLKLIVGDSKSKESKQLIKAFKEILLQMVDILHEAYTDAFTNYGTLLKQMKQNDIPINSRKHTYKIIYLYLFIMQHKFAYVKAKLNMALSGNPGQRSKRVVEMDMKDDKKLLDDFTTLFGKEFRPSSYTKIQKKLSQFDLFSV
jgi:hypothetical protein